jgi:hypothetical protein
VGTAEVNKTPLRERKDQDASTTAPKAARLIL